jgi:hypothetical protein
MQKGLPLGIVVASILKTAIVIIMGLAFSLSLDFRRPASAQTPAALIRRERERGRRARSNTRRRCAFIKTSTMARNRHRP